MDKKSEFLKTEIDFEKTANSIIDIIQLSRQLEDIIINYDDTKNETSAEVNVLLSHISYHILDSKYIYEMFKEEKKQFFYDIKNVPIII